MLSGELAQIVSTILQDYNGLNIESLIQETVNVLASRPSMGAQQYSVHVGQLRSRIQQMVSRQSQLLKTERVRALIHQSTFPNALPDDIAHNLRSMLTDRFEFAAQSSEANLLLHSFQQARGTFASLASSLDKLHLDEFDFDPEKIVFTLQIPKSEEWTFGDLAEKCEKFAEFFRLASEYRLGHAEQPSVAHLSMSDLIVFFTTTSQAALSLLPILKELLEYAKLFAETKNLFKSLTGISKDSSVDELMASVQKHQEEELTKRLESLAGNLNAGPGRQTEIQGRFISSSKHVAREIANGTEIEIRTSSELTIRLADAGKAEEQQDARRLLQELESLRAALNVVRGEGAGSILLPKSNA